VGGEAEVENGCLLDSSSAQGEYTSATTTHPYFPFGTSMNSDVISVFSSFNPLIFAISLSFQPSSFSIAYYSQKFEAQSSPLRLETVIA